MKEHDKWYLATLAVIAVVILVAGSALRPPKMSVDTVVSESERFRLQMLAQKRSLQNAAQYFSDLADRAAVHVVAVGSGSGVVWSSDLIVAARVPEEDNTPIRSQAGLLQVKERWSAPNGGAAVLIPAAGQSMPAVPFREGEPPVPGAWIVTVSRRLDGSVAFLQGAAGGVVDSHCGGVSVQRVVSNLPMDAVPAGSGVFDLEGRLTGVALACEGGGVTLLTASSVQKLVDRATSLDNRLASRLGLRTVRLTAGLAGQFGADEGLLVHEVWDGYPAAAAGLRPGDVLVEANGQLLATPAILEELTAAADPPTDLRVIRQRLPVRLKLKRTAPGPQAGPHQPARLMRLHAPPDYPLVARIPPGSRAEAAGLKAGDEVLEVNGRRPQARELARIEEQIEGRDPMFLVVRRPGYSAGVFVR